MDIMLTEKDRKLAEKEAYIVHLQTAVAGDQPITPKRQKVCFSQKKKDCTILFFKWNPAIKNMRNHVIFSIFWQCNCTILPQVDEDNGAMQELQQLVQNLTKKVGEAEERYSLLQEQTDSLKELLDTEKEQYSQKESMYKQNVRFCAVVVVVVR